MSEGPQKDDLSTALILETGRSRAVFSVRGARLLSLEFDGRELLRTDDARGDVWYGAFVMAPWAGLLRGATLLYSGKEYALPANWDGHSLHGVARFADFAAVGGELVGSLPPIWPFGGFVTVAPRLDETSFDVLFTVTAGDESMPVALGWHPWFRRSIAASKPLVLRLPDDARKLARDAAGLPTADWNDVGDGPWDDCLRTASAVELEWPDVGTLSVATTGGFIGIYSGEDSGVAVEPMNAPVESLPIELAPGESVSLSVRMEWRAA